MPSQPNQPSNRDLELISAYLDGMLDAEQTEIIEAQLAHDENLRAALNDLRENKALLGSLPRFKAPRDFTLDPATFRRRASWWQHYAQTDIFMQLSGALGAAAAIIMITLALLNGQQDTAKMIDQSSTAVSYAEKMDPSPSSTSEIHIGTASPQALTFGANADEIGTTNTAPMVENAAPLASDPASESAEAEMPMDTAEHEALAPSIPSINSDAGSAGATGAVSEPTIVPPSTAPNEPIEEDGIMFDTEDSAASDSTLAESAGMGESQPSGVAVGAPTVGSSAPGDTPDSAVDAADEADGLAREAPEAPAPMVPSPTRTSATIASTDAEATPSQMPTAKEEPDTKRSSHSEETGISSQTWLAGIGLVLLIVSVTLFIAGKKRSKRR